MSNHPNGRTSNYGWALWHLEAAESPNTSGPEVAQLHAAMAQARATLALLDAQVGSHGGTTWTDLP